MGLYKFGSKFQVVKTLTSKRILRPNFISLINISNTESKIIVVQETDNKQNKQYGDC